MIVGDVLWISVPDLAVCLGMSKGLGWGEGFDCTWFLLAHLPEEVDPRAVFPLRLLDLYPMRRHPGPPDAPVFGPHQSDSEPNLDVSARPRVELTPLCCEATG